MYWIMEEDTLKEFELMLYEKRHKEVIEVLKSVLESIDRIDFNPEVKISNKIDTKILEDMVSKIATKNDIEKIPAAIMAIGDVISKKINAIKINAPVVNYPNEWTFTVERDRRGLITKIIANS